jgi:tetratricopeptide (TPR) repeat protein
MKWPVIAILLLSAVPGGAAAGDFAMCAQSVDSELKFAGCSELVAREPKMATAYSSRGLALVAMGETDRAIADYSYAIGLDPGLMVAYYNRGLSYLEIGEPELAEEDFTAVIARNPADATAFHGRALAYVALNRYSEADADLTRAVGLDPKYARAYVSRGNLALSRGHADAALKDFDAALKFAPLNQDAISGRNFALAGGLPEAAESVGSTSPLIPDAAEPETAPEAVAIPRIPRALRAKVRPIVSVPRIAKPARIASFRPVRPLIVKSPPLAKTAPVVKATVALKPVVIARPVTVARPVKAKPTVAVRVKPLYDPLLTERSCNNYQGEPCAVSSR